VKNESGILRILKEQRKKQKMNGKTEKKDFFHPMIFKIWLRRALKDHFLFTWSPPARNEI